MNFQKCSPLVRFIFRSSWYCTWLWGLLRSVLCWEVGLSWQLSGKDSAYHAGDRGSIPGSGRSPGGGHGNPLEYSYLENPMDRGAWQAAVHRVEHSQIWLKQLNSSCMLEGIVGAKARSKLSLGACSVTYNIYPGRTCLGLPAGSPRRMRLGAQQRS